MKKLLSIVSALIPTVLLVGGAVAVAGGISLIYTPAGIIAGGVLAISAGILIIKGGTENDE